MKTLGHWITDGSIRPFYARKEFEVTKEVASSTAKVCGLGQFVFWLNGKKVDDHELDPGWTAYDKLIEYVTFDVKDYLMPGRNALGAEVGNGWFLKNDEHYTFAFPPFMPPNPNPYKPFGSSLVLALELEIAYTDGTCDVIRADDSFRVQRHPVLQSNVFGSETIDGSLRQDGWAEAGFDDSLWAPASIVAEDDEPKGELIDQLQPPIKVIRSYPAVYLHTVNGRDIYDFGQNMAGILQFEARGRKGDVIRVYPAEKLREDGDVDQVAKNWITVDSVLTYIIGEDDVWETFRMKFTYFAGKVIAVEKNGETAEVRNIVGNAVTSAWKDSGSFTCDDERFNQIYHIVQKSVEANMVSVHTDCPTIERFAWQEPNHLMGAAIMYMKDGRKLWEKFLLDMRTGQHTAEDYFFDFAGKKVYPGDGLVPSQCPCYIPNVLPVPGMGSFYDIIPWGSSIILGARWHYLFYGDKQILADNYDAGMRYLNHLKRMVTEDGFINHGLGDWGNPENELARENIETAFLYADTITLAWFAEVLGKTGDQNSLLAYAEEIKHNYNAKLLVRDEAGCWCYRSWEKKDALVVTQACEALPLYWGLVPEDKVRDVVCCFRRTLEDKNAFVAGEVGLPYIIQTAARYGMNDLIADYITHEEHPSYYAFVKDGMTTLGEYWENNPRSHCHDMMGHIIEWYYNGLAGIQIREPGFRKVTIRPYLPVGMNTVSCTYESAAGPIEVGIRRRGNEIQLKVRLSGQIACDVDTSELSKCGTVTVQVETV